MTRLTLPALGLCLALPLPALALDLESMSDVERGLFRAEVRAFLLENPEVIMEAVAVLEEREKAAKELADVELVRANLDELLNDGHSWEGGNPDGDLVLVEFIDYRCGYCRRAHNEVEQLIEMDGNIRFIVKEFPILGQESELSSRFAIATHQLAGDEAYKSAHDALITFKGQVNDTSLLRIAETLGLEGQSILDHMQSDAVTKVIAENHSLAGRLQISGTPSFVMGERMLRGYLPLDGMMQIAEAIRAN
ncbi:DsbA family protein [Roseovarius faecimaris]|uniref:DsbA family protein n=1 Tax=Roseovarius faecimaris TaxID=2494550 RepID=A0A6I6INN2_9RHOB|nr:DsbA family protein [Roseovarius faecimaris]QGX98649.1 DsbA family protein [Roseovarius faecimaris]